jgi:transposase-like protein
MPKPIDTGWPYPKKVYRSYTCIDCGKTFTDLKSLALHKSTCSKKGAAE